MKKVLAILILTISHIQIASSLEIEAKAFILKDITTGRVIASKNESVLMPPASLTKLMTLYLLFDHLKKTKTSLKTELKVSDNAWKKGGSKMFLDPRKKVSIIDLIKGMTVASGNDASTVIAEYISGNEYDFVDLMNKTAREMGMFDTNFANATGWDREDHLSTAKDLAILSEKLINDFPEFYKVFSLRSFRYSGITQRNKNTLLGGQLGVDGLKTGHVVSVGYNIVSSAKKGTSRFLIVLLGADSTKKRETEVQKLYRYAYNNYKKVPVLSSNKNITNVKTYLCDQPHVKLGLKEDFYVNLTKEEAAELKSTIQYPSVLNAPVKEGDELGEIVFYLEDSKNFEPISKPLIAKTSCTKVKGLEKFKQKLSYKLNIFR